VLGFDTQAEGVEARRHLGYLPSEPRFYPKMTARHLFDLVAHTRRLEPRRHYVEYAAALAQRLDLDTTRHIRTLSRGNQQKVGLVVAMMARPDVLVLDEPTTGLDPLIQEVTHDLVREVASDGRTVFFSSHVLPEVEEVCHRVAALRDGSLVGVYDLAEQRRLAPRRVSVTFDTAPSPTAFEALPGVRAVELAGRHVVLEARDGVDALIKRLADFKVLDLEAREPTLEEFFFSLYEGAPPEAALTGRNER
jgi:ABC-2 type transport system ATP-binding protein